MSEYKMIPAGRGTRALVTCLIWAVASWSCAAGLQPFGTDDMRTIERRYNNQQFIVALWSLTCPPCLEELETLARWQDSHPNVPLVLINTDPLENAEAATAKLAEVELEDADNWMFGDSFIEKLRHAVDPNWRGELPRSYLYGKTERSAVSGKLTYEQLQAWLKNSANAQQPQTHHTH
jgi:thiol-disulfide isomerase/thioredoxin